MWSWSIWISITMLCTRIPTPANRGFYALRNKGTCLKKYKSLSLGQYPIQ